MDTGLSTGSKKGRRVLLATILASSTAFLIGSAVPVALPAIQAHFDTSLAGIQWVINGFLVSLASLLLIGGSLGDHFGRKRIFSWGIIIFAAGASLSGFAWSISWLIAFQALQGAGAALMVPQSLALISGSFRESQRGQAIGLWAGLSGGVVALAPLLSGWLVDTFSWRAVFFLVVPLSLLALAVAIRSVSEHCAARPRKLDWAGTLFIFLGLVGIAYGLVSGPAAGWQSLRVIISLAGGIAALAFFVVAERYQREPLVPLQVFSNPLVKGANLVTLGLYFALNGVIVYFVLNLQQVQGFSPTLAGLALLPTIILITVLSAPAGALSDRIGPRKQMIAGPLLVAAGSALLITGNADARYLLEFMPGLVLLGIGMALVIAPLTRSALAVEPEFTGAASGVNNAVSRVAALLAVAVLGVVMVSFFASNLAGRLENSPLDEEERAVILDQADRLGGIDIPAGFTEEARAAAERIIRESFVYAFRWSMAVTAAVALSAAAVSFSLIRDPPRKLPP
ncbi:MAG: MFS transporter [Dehalococcoidia bacterium]|nr:MFS transporter [Dehalococcoidia bacterium]